MKFENEKKQCLARIDRSKKQSVDKNIRQIVDFLNSLHNYYTTSSCSGRVMLIEMPEKGRKKESEWMFVSHEKATADSIKKALSKKTKNEVWLRQEGAIMHVCCRSMEDAQRLLSIVREQGFKRSGMISVHNRIMVEIMSTECISAIVAKNGKVPVDDNYIKILAASANSSMALNKRRIERLYCALRAPQAL